MSCPRRKRHGRAARRRADGDLSGLQRRLCGHSRRAAGEDRSLRGGHPPGTPGEDVDGAAASGRSDRLCSRSCCFTMRGAMRGSMRRAISSFWKSRIAAAGISGRLPRRCRWSRRRCAAGPVPMRCRRRSPPLHCQAARAEDTDWPQIVRLYDLLERLQPSADRVAEPCGGGRHGGGPRPALAIIDALAAASDLDDYHLLHAARADLLRRIGILGGSGEELRAGARAGHQ